MVLTSAEFVTVSVTGVAVDTGEGEIRARFAEFGQVLRVELHHVAAEGPSDNSAARPRPERLPLPDGSAGQQKASSSWARVTFREPASAEAAVSAQARLGQPWKLKGAKPAAMDHTFVQVGYFKDYCKNLPMFTLAKMFHSLMDYREVCVCVAFGLLDHTSVCPVLLKPYAHIHYPAAQHGQRLKVTWRCGRPAGVAFIQMATPKDAQALLRKLPRTGPSRNMLPLGPALGKAFVSLRHGMDRLAWVARRGGGILEVLLMGSGASVMRDCVQIPV